MYNQIKKLADEAIALQNKDRMDEVLRYISAICTPGNVMMVDGRYKTSIAPPADLGASVEEAVTTLASPDGASLIGFDTARAEVHGGPISEPSPDADAYKAATEAAKNVKPAPAAMSDDVTRQLADAEALTSSTNFGGRKIEGKAKFAPGKKPTAKKGGAK